MTVASFVTMLFNQMINHTRQLFTLIVFFHVPNIETAFFRSLAFTQFSLPIWQSLYDLAFAEFLLRDGFPSKTKESRL